MCSVITRRVTTVLHLTIAFKAVVFRISLRRCQGIIIAPYRPDNGCMLDITVLFAYKNMSFKLAERTQTVLWLSYRLDEWYRVQITSGERVLSSLKYVHTNSGTQPASYSMSNGSKAAGTWSWSLASWCLVKYKWRMYLYSSYSFVTCARTILPSLSLSN